MGATLRGSYNGKLIIGNLGVAEGILAISGFQIPTLLDCHRDQQPDSSGVYYWRVLVGLFPDSSF